MAVALGPFGNAFPARAGPSGIVTDINEVKPLGDVGMLPNPNLAASPSGDHCSGNPHSTIEERDGMIGRLERSILCSTGCATLTGVGAPDEIARHVPPLCWQQISLTGDYSWNVDDRLDPDALRPLGVDSLLLAARCSLLVRPWRADTSRSCSYPLIHRRCMHCGRIFSGKSTTRSWLPNRQNLKRRHLYLR